MGGRTNQTFAPPVMQARKWMDGVTQPADRPFLNVSQAAPADPPPPALRQAMAQMVLEDPGAHLYGPVLGLPDLRAEVAQQWSQAYRGRIAPDQVAITSGCNQAFAAAIATLARDGDQVIVPVPYYFNHAMWLDMSGITLVPLPVGTAMLPDVDDCAALITPRTRAITLVSPNNPCGVEYPAALLRAFADLARVHDIALIVDETYRDFDSRIGSPHDLFGDPEWDDTLIHLYSFSKAYRLTGHRVGAMIASADRLKEAEKFLDTVTICPNQLGQRAALWGLQNLGDWLASERKDILNRRAAIRDHFPVLAEKGWQLLGAGAYFAYLQHPFATRADDLSRRLVADQGILALPGTMFMPPDQRAGEQQLRIAFANIDNPGIEMLFHRLATITR